MPIMNLHIGIGPYPMPPVYMFMCVCRLVGASAGARRCELVDGRRAVDRLDRRDRRLPEERVAGRRLRLEPAVQSATDSCSCSCGGQSRRLERSHSGDGPRSHSTIAGGLFAVCRTYFEHIRTFDVREQPFPSHILFPSSHLIER